MPVCRHCGTRITKFDTDRCPVCGELNPLEGVTSDTVEITTEIDLSDELKKTYLSQIPAGRFGVFIKPGATQFAVIPREATSAAIDFVNAIIPPLDAA